MARGGTVLVVDNDPFNLDLVTMILRRGGFKVLRAASGPEVLEVCSKHRPDLILMDIQLPGVDGLEVTRRLRADPKTGDLRIIAFSSFDLPETRIKAIDAGCEDYITKPISARDLIEVVKQHLGSGGGKVL